MSIAEILAQDLGLSPGNIISLNVGDKSFRLKIIHTISKLPGLGNHFSDRYLNKGSGGMLLTPMSYDYIRRSVWNDYAGEGR